MRSSAGQAEAAGELVDEQAAAGTVGLEPFAVDDELGDGALADVAQDFGFGGGIGVNIDLDVGDAVGLEELLGGAAVAAPRSRVEMNRHNLIVTLARLLGCDA